MINKLQNFIKEVKTQKEIKKLMKKDCSIDELVAHGANNDFTYDEATLRILFKADKTGKLKLDEKELEKYLNKEIDKKFKKEMENIKLDNDKVKDTKIKKFINEVKSDIKIKKLINNGCSIDQLVDHANKGNFTYDEATLRLLYKADENGKLKLDEKGFEDYINKKITETIEEKDAKRSNKKDSKLRIFIKEVKNDIEIKKLINDGYSIDELVNHANKNNFIYDEETLRLLYKDDGTGKLKLDEKGFEDYINKKIDKNLSEKKIKTNNKK
ncbi:MAG: hypothetical protein ACRDCF_01650 [Mycoplasmoidaceae bacterium]